MYMVLLSYRVKADREQRIVRHEAKDTLPVILSKLTEIADDEDISVISVEIFKIVTTITK